MNRLLKTCRNVLSNHLLFFLLAVVMFWLKTYIGYRNEFNLGISNSMQKFLLFINPISSTLFFFGLALFAKGKRSYIWLIIINFIMTFLLYANIVYYRFFTDFITIPTLTQTNNFGDLGGSITALLKPHDFIYFIDTIILIVLTATKITEPKPTRMKKRTVVAIFAFAIMVFCINLGLAEEDRPQLLSRTFDRNYLVKYLGAYNFTIYDAIQNTQASAQKAFADSNDITDVQNYVSGHYAAPNPTYFGAAKGMNVIYIHLESFQNFLINYKLNGQEVTPYLNSLTKDPNTLYFDNFFHQTGQGKTSDAEFMLENSLFGLPQGAVATTKAQNTMESQPAILGEMGYDSAVFHGNYKTFWNRDEIYKSYGINKFFDASYFDMNKNDVVNYGLKDKPFFKEVVPMMQTLKEPFYAKFITLSNHFPYPIEKSEATIGPDNTGDGSVDRYFQTARYLDEAVQSFMDYLKQTGLWDRSVIVFYGDHYGISENHDKAMEKVMGEKITPYVNAQLQKVPLIIHVPGIKGGVMHQYGGEVDVLPTVLHLLGVDTKKYIQFGTDLLSPSHNQVIPFRNGDFVSPTVNSINGKYYDTATGLPIKKNAEIKKDEKEVTEQLQLSDKVVYGDLLRFYTPQGFKPIDRNKYDYTKHPLSYYMKEKTDGKIKNSGK